MEVEAVELKADLRFLLRPRTTELMKEESGPKVSAVITFTGDIMSRKKVQEFKILIWRKENLQVQAISWRKAISSILKRIKNL